MKPYLFVYNLASCAGWAYVLYLAVVSLAAGESFAAGWARYGPVLQIVQTAAVLELLHSLTGMVPSPFFSAFVQVFSRVGILWMVTSFSPAAQAHWSQPLITLSWAAVEVPRYAFYAVNIITKKVPAPLFLARYSLFAVLYPSGIVGEIMQVVQTMPLAKSCAITLGGVAAACPAWWYALLFALACYVPGAPFMYMHMVAQRKRAIAARNAPAKAAPSGLVFPPGRKGDRSTTEAGKQVFAASIDAIDKKAADAVRRERDWRFGYAAHVVKNVELAAQSPETCLKIADAGLKYMHESFEFIRGDRTMSLATAMKEIKSSFHTGFVRGTKPKPSSFEFAVPYKGRQLAGAPLQAQLNAWASAGTIEPEARDAIALVASKKEWLDLSDRWFVLLGAGSAMGPLPILLNHGANVIAVDLDRSPVWERIINMARNSCGTLTWPMKVPMTAGMPDAELFAQSGCNLFTHCPEVKNWLVALQPDKPLTIGCYTYLDGALHVQVALACDAIMRGVIESGRKNLTLSFLCSPTDVFMRYPAAHKAAEKAYATAPWWQKLLSAVGLLRKNARKPITAADGSDIHIVDGLVVAQGPNYALAKRLQHWRAMLARSQGVSVSTNIAPSTTTPSVVHNTQFAAAYAGLYLFPPMEVMFQETSNAVMGAMLLHDVCNPNGISKPTTPTKTPLELFASGSFHGGIWRSAYKMNDMGPVAAGATYLKRYAVHLAAALGALAYGANVVRVKGAPHTW